MKNEPLWYIEGSSYYINVPIVQLGYEQTSFQRVPKLIPNLSNVMIRQVTMQQAILSIFAYGNVCNWLDISRNKTCLCLIYFN